MIETLRFDEPSHTYWIGERKIVNVTRVLDFFCHSYDHVPRETLERARQEGQAVHRAIEYHIAGTLDHCPPWLEPYILAWERFVFDTRFELESSEQRHYHPGLDYCGTSDLIGWMDFPKLGRRHTLIDIKRSFCAGPAIGLQTTAYAAAYQWGGGDHIQQRFALRFRPGMDPPYATEHFNDPRDHAAWANMLGTYRWLQENGKL